MPELPEVEVIKRGLSPHVSDRTITAVWCSSKKLRESPDCSLLQTHLIGATFTSIHRRAKFLLLRAEDCTLVIHLGMTGNLGIFETGSKFAKHDHLALSFENNTELRFNDTRRFGMIRLVTHNDICLLDTTMFKAYGPEPFSSRCSEKSLYKKAAGKKQSVKNFLMDNRNIVGVGNIYANETLFHAKILPTRPAGSLSLKEWRVVYTKLIETLQWAIECGGSTISDFINASGESGYFQANFKVYGKAGINCSACNGTIEKNIIGGRASFYCSTCQK